VSIRGYRYWFEVVDVCTKLKLSFGAPSLVAGMKTLDYEPTRECNRVNKDISSIYQLVGEPRKLHINASDPSVVRKQFIDLVADLTSTSVASTGRCRSPWMSMTTSRRFSRGSATLFATTASS
jgi:hypothetical protein